jgi:hypothetical protein
MSSVPKCNCKCRFGPERNQENLIIQLTAPVKWTQSVTTNDSDGATLFTEVGPEKTCWFNWKIDKGGYSKCIIRI